MTETPETSKEAYKDILEDGEDVSLRRQVAAVLGEQPMTVHELAQTFEERSEKAIQPRVSELVRMGCVRREGKRENPSGNDAYVHHLTETGRRYVDGEEEPEMEPRLSEMKNEVVDVAREVVRGNADVDVLHIVLERHDELKKRREPDWEPPSRA